MLIPNLSVLLAERRLTISKAAQDTGISRTTLTALTSRSARGIQFDTLNRLCQYLKVTPDALFIYRPFDIALSVEGLPGPSCAVFTITSAGGVKEIFRMRCDAEFKPSTESQPATLESLRVRLSLPDAPEDADAFFPVIDPEIWREDSRSDMQVDPATGITYEFVVYRRR